MRGYKVIAIESPVKNVPHRKDDVAIRGLNPVPHLSYVRALRSFARRRATSYDVVLEKGWRLSGLALAAFRQQGIPGALVENDARYWSEPIASLRTMTRYCLHRVARLASSSYSRRAPVTIAETEELRDLLVKYSRISPDQIEVVGLGVNHALFQSMTQASARDRLGIGRAVTVLLYAGGMDRYHDLNPLIEALGQVKLPTFELHLVGDGVRRSEYEERARQARVAVRFHGQVPHPEVPRYIATADLCLAPYCENAFYDRAVSFSTLKIPEYMACGRPVASNPSGNIRRLIKHQESGFLVSNDISSWAQCLRALPSREALDSMGHEAARTVEPLTWEKTSARYLQVCQRLAEKRVHRMTKGSCSVNS
jgi:glycosyltransferase involved in cell wall biosynthesis